jgi:hypothetical protein
MYARKIENASASELKMIFEKQISRGATILTDKWKGYSPLAETYDIRQGKSEPDKNLRVMHRFIQQLKSWIRRIHHSVDHDYLQGYLDEFCFMINRYRHKNTIFYNLLQRMVLVSKTTKDQIKFAYV